MINRRAFMISTGAAGLAAATVSRAALLAEPGALPPKSPMGIASTAMSLHLGGVDAGLRGAGAPMRGDPVRYLEYLRSIGAGGIQHAVSTDLPRFRKRLDELEMYYEGEARLPGKLTDDLSGFEESVKNSATLGATVMRAVSRPPAGRAPGGRRYSTFYSYDEYKAWEKEANAIVEKCLPIAERYKVAIALENHKDRTAAEHAAFLKRFDSEYLGALVDPGNNLSLMEDIDETVGQLAPYAKACSLKDMGVAPYAEGFLLSEVRFGKGIYDQKKIFATLRKFNPKILPTTELITRDPLQIPVLTKDYYKTLPDREAKRESWMAMIRAKQSDLPRVEQLGPAQRLQAEEDNNRQVMTWGLTNLA
jgi:sugar phosphate isomerase/epimerase